LSFIRLFPSLRGDLNARAQAGELLFQQSKNIRYPASFSIQSKLVNPAVKALEFTSDESVFLPASGAADEHSHNEIRSDLATQAYLIAESQKGGAVTTGTLVPIDMVIRFNDTFADADSRFFRLALDATSQRNLAICLSNWKGDSR
jgi:hypothetical protein